MTFRPTVRVVRTLLALVVLLFAAPAAADPTIAKIAKTALRLHATSIFGHEAAMGYGWSDVVATIENQTASSIKGNLELASSLSYGHQEEFTTRVPFNVAAGRSAVVQLPTHGYADVASTFTVNAVGENGDTLASVIVNINATVAPLLVDVEDPSRLALALRGVSLHAEWNPAVYRSGPGLTLTVGAPSFDESTGDPILPDQASGYAPVTVALVHSNVLARIPAARIEALIDWVLSGGTLAVVVTRPEDLHGPVLTALVGGTATVAEVNPEVLAPETIDAADSPYQLNPSGPHPSPEPTQHPVELPGLLRARLAGYTGGNLHPSLFGATARYGMGEVHLLAFDPSWPPAVEDVWARNRLVDLVSRAWDRRSLNALWSGARLPSGQINEVRRSLDPNENFRPALGVAAILLVLYSIVAGPITFMRAAKRAKPLGPLLWVPIWSAVAFGGVVLIGLAGKGWHGRGRHMSLVEAGAGASRGAIRRFRGFFTSSVQSMTVAATDATCVLDVDGDAIGRDHRVLRIDRNGGALDNLTSLPWQTVVVVEDGFLDIGEGVAIVPGHNGTVDIVNRTGHALRDVVVLVPNKDPVYFAEFATGAKLSSSEGRTMSTASPALAKVGSTTVHPLNVSSLAGLLDTPTTDRLQQTWGRLAEASGPQVDWLPDDAPALLAEVVGGEGRARDSTLPLEQDRVFLRVVGSGGTP